MYGILSGLLIAVLLLYLLFLKRELRRVRREMKGLPARAGYGGRLSIDFRDKDLFRLVDELNVLIDSFEEKNRQSRTIEENLRVSVAGISHDLRTPLTSILGYVHLLHETKDEAKRAQYLKIIEGSVERLMEMSDNFYDLARIETNQKEIKFTAVQLSSFVEEIFLSQYEQFEEKGLDIHFPDFRAETEAIADKIILARVVQNLIQNILRYAYSQAFISYRLEPDYLVLQLRNDVKPDSKMAIEKVFLLFYTEDASRTNSESSGLGLYISRKLVEKMNGKMEVDLQDNWFTLTVHLRIKAISKIN